MCGISVKLHLRDNRAETCPLFRFSDCPFVSFRLSVCPLVSVRGVHPIG